MAPEKVTIMVLTVDLQCDRCYRKVKKVLCKFPQIRDQLYNEKNNTVTIKVVCCSPEKVRDKICCKGRKSIKSIEIIEPPPPQPPKPPQPAPAPAPKPPKPDPPPPASKPPPPAPTPVPEKPPEKEKPKPESKPKPPQPNPPKLPAPPPPQPQPPPSQPQLPVYPPPPGMYVCCQDCYEGRSGGPCYGSYYTNRPGPCEPPLRPPISGGGYYGGWAPSSQNNYYYPTSRCGDYFSEENPQSCIIM